MTNLTKQDNFPQFTISDRLEGAKREMVRASFTERFFDAMGVPEKKQAINDFIFAYIKKAHLISGNKPHEHSSSDLRTLVDEIIKTIKDYKWFRVGDLEIIFSEGLRGRLGDTYGFTALAVETWIKSYQYGERQEAMKEQIRFQQAQEKLAEEKNREKLMKESNERCVMKINDRIGKDLPVDITNHPPLFDYLKSEGLITVDQEYRSTLIESFSEKLKKASPGLINKPDIVRAQATWYVKDRLFREWALTQTKKI